MIPVSGAWSDAFRRSVETPYDLARHEAVPPQLEGYDTLRIWGTTETDSAKKQTAVDAMKSGDWLLFYHDGALIAGGQVGRVFENTAVGELIWGRSESRHIFTVEGFTQTVPSIERVWELLDYAGRHVVHGFTRVADERVSQLVTEHGPLERTLFGGDAEEPSDAEIEQATSELNQMLDSEPELTDETSYVQTYRVARDRVFTRLVRRTYAGRCAVCGSQRESPAGNPEVEAAHIYPKSSNGKDDVRNGIALCKLHHWAFDAGWLSVTNDHRILVADAPDKHGYNEFMQLEGTHLELPDDDDQAPHPLFLEKPREIHGFEG